MYPPPQALDRDTFRKIMMQSGQNTMSQRVTFLNKVQFFYQFMV
jgi:hypothetical protein